ncbi:hypothetical protein BV25DRAFT_1922492 [Artomyces pyxidatus]|uniref:Uncharacterized protein n=1 Tax=Artomyces pyxidatus TaxID=48021 RepID=A0ACB8SEP9_9AGAM|nr:hypothetical protein BV25DRAFT_1922492 [Artomyces pyxidatus]
MSADAQCSDTRNGRHYKSGESEVNASAWHTITFFLYTSVVSTCMYSRLEPATRSDRAVAVASLVLRFWRFVIRQAYEAVNRSIPLADLAVTHNHLDGEPLLPRPEECGHNLYYGTNGLLREDEAQVLCAYIHILHGRSNHALANDLNTFLCFQFAENALVRFLSDRRFLDNDDLDLDDDDYYP